MGFLSSGGKREEKRGSEDGGPGFSLKGNFIFDSNLLADVGDDGRWSGETWSGGGAVVLSASSSSPSSGEDVGRRFKGRWSFGGDAERFEGVVDIVKLFGLKQAFKRLPC